MIVQDGAEAVCEECGLIIKRTVSKDGNTVYIHHLPSIPASQAGKDQLDKFYEKCPNLYRELKIK